MGEVQYETRPAINDKYGGMHDLLRNKMSVEQ